MKKFLLSSAAILLAACNQGQLPTSQNSSPTSNVAPAPEIEPTNYLDGAWTSQQTQAILDKTMRLNLAYDASAMSAGEEAAVKELLLAGDRFHSMYLEQRHPQARAAETALNNVSGRQDLKDVFRIMKGPITTTLNNERVFFLGGRKPATNVNVYPQNTTKEILDAFTSANPNMRQDILHLRSVVRTASEANKSAALDVLDTYPALDVLHPGLRQKIEGAIGFFALPYSAAYAEDIFYVYDRLHAAANHMEPEDLAFARFLRLRARDLLADDYDGGDAAWISSRFTGKLNAQIGSYETYDDYFYGVKSFFSLSLLQRDIEKSDELAASIGDIQSIEDALPYSANKTVRSDIPVGVYNVIADFGQARGTNTASILPNEGHLSRQYGRTILIRSNVLRNPEIFAETNTAFQAAVARPFHTDHRIDGNFYRTLWHEIGHYMGPDQTKTGGDIDAALQDVGSLMEEMKADLVSLFSVHKLNQRGAFSDEELRSIYAAGIMRVLQKNRPRRTQAYGTMKLVQFNWFLDKGLIEMRNGQVWINYERYESAVNSLLKAVLNLQYQGDRDAANQFIDRWVDWDENLHGKLGNRMKHAEGSRFRLVTYEALGEK
jgi:hypothetical protein